MYASRFYCMITFTVIALNVMCLCVFNKTHIERTIAYERDNACNIRSAFVTLIWVTRAVLLRHRPSSSGIRHARFSIDTTLEVVMGFKRSSQHVKNRQVVE